MNLSPVVRKKRVYQDIVEQIKQAIERGEILHGEKLPSERTLAESFSVSRSSVKEAFSVLESAGVVEIKQGSGVFLLKNSTEDTITKINAAIRGVAVDIVELMELRQAIEGDAAYYAAMRGSREDVEAVYQAFGDLEKAVINEKVAAEEDFAFHMSIAKAARNSIIEKVMYMLSDQVLEGLSKSRANTLAAPNKSQLILEEHRMIYHAIRDGNPELAKEAMCNHLQKVKQRYL
ncbi:GntR family transcriptional regulator [Virgibacillus phasianinus]|uniref:GntR family transcriptional regulator n=1 Tax=Virgibacillus phasianinus TaxID=2017483 RepID=A0A220U2D4_9BACI|nr:FadR/GntR family transcriptional regulator [Virgibacillus phasianinus]ASK62152.1 GntR family transcriptional regulator [Virgibacillus phasianinus]